MRVEIDPTDIVHDDASEPVSPREIICPITGLPVVAAKPGQRGLSLEEIKQLLEDFP